jgi:UrcA family protein
MILSVKADSGAPNRATRGCRAILAAVTLLAAGLAGTSAYGAPPSVPLDSAPTALVRYGDLNVSEPLGARRLLERIRAAAGRVCPEADSRDLAAMQIRWQCMNDAVARAVQQVHSPAVAALYRRSGGRG